MRYAEICNFSLKIVKFFELSYILLVDLFGNPSFGLCPNKVPSQVMQNTAYFAILIRKLFVN